MIYPNVLLLIVWGRAIKNIFGLFNEAQSLCRSNTRLGS